MSKVVAPTLATSCSAFYASDLHGRGLGQVVERVDTNVVSVAFRPFLRGRPDRFLYGCDAVGPGKKWCAYPVGQYTKDRGKRLADARLGVLCGNEKIASAWVEPVPDAAWIAVADSGYTELYPVTHSLPVRISRRFARLSVTTTFRIAEYSLGGTLLKRWVLVTAVAG